MACSRAVAVLMNINLGRGGLCCAMQRGLRLLFCHALCILRIFYGGFKQRPGIASVGRTTEGFSLCLDMAFRRFARWTPR